MGLDSIKVSCFSGHTYAQRPVSFIFEGKEHEVVEIIKEWQAPEEKCFQVKTNDNKIFRLCYNEARDKWQAAELKD